tara:strand:+ start:13692 stop:14249 length:558 start_codon:yes stop_codon:yes gene_type:complete
MIVDNNFLPQGAANDILDRVVINGLDIPWTLAYRTDTPSSKYAVDDANVKQSYQFAAGLVPGSPAYDYFMKVFHAFVSKHNIFYNKVIRVKLNWLPKATLNTGYHTPHVDYDSEHKVFLYYINDSDGDTIFFQETLSEDAPESFTEDFRVNPEAGRGVIFDGSIYHASSSPVKSEFRCILNIDFT